VEEGKVSEVELHDTLKGGIAGTVLEAGKPVADVKIKLFNSDLGPMAMFPVKVANTDANGAYLFKKLEQGKYDVRLDLTGLAEPPEETVTLTPGRITMQDFVLPSGRVSGRVMDAVTGDPISGVSISLKSKKKAKKGGLFDSLFSESSMVISVDGKNMLDDGEDEAQAQLQFLGLGGPKPVATDKEGRYEIAFVADGEYSLAASCEGYAKNELDSVTVKAGVENAGLDLNLVPGFKVSGIVVEDATGKPLKLCSITCEKFDPVEKEWKKLKSITSKDLGKFAFNRLSPGSYRLTAKKKDLKNSLDFKLEGAGKDDLELRMR
jgi:5-hydroxyisourate hydrolase-like protein (transthyretin family)